VGAMLSQPAWMQSSFCFEQNLRVLVEISRSHSRVAIIGELVLILSEQLTSLIGLREFLWPEFSKPVRGRNWSLC